MGDRGKDMGDMRAIRAKMAAKYDNDAEAEVRGWFQSLIGVEIEAGAFNVERHLKSGVDLLKLMQEIFAKTANKPDACSRCDTKITTSNLAFKQMENIDKFLKAAEAYGVPKASLFQTPDLYEGRNLAQVISTIIMLGTETKRCGMSGPTIGPNPTEKNYRVFSETTLRQGRGIIGLQAGTNQCASQKGYSMGRVRHVADIPVQELDREGQGVISKQSMGAERGAAGLSFGTPRHAADLTGAGALDGQAEYQQEDAEEPEPVEDGVDAEAAWTQESAPPPDEESSNAMFDGQVGWAEEGDQQEATFGEEVAAVDDSQQDVEWSADAGGEADESNAQVSLQLGGGGGEDGVQENGEDFSEQATFSFGGEA